LFIIRKLITIFRSNSRPPYRSRLREYGKCSYLDIIMKKPRNNQKDGVLYTAMTNDLERRMRKHRTESVQGFTR